MADDADVIDLDAMLAARAEKEAIDDEIEYRPMRLYGRLWRVRAIPNAFALMRAGSGDLGGATDFLLGFVHVNERDDFRRALLADEHLGDDKIAAILDLMSNAEVGRPTTGPSPSTESSPDTGPSSTDD